MSPAFAIEHGATSVLGVVILEAIGFGTWRFGFPICSTNALVVSS